MAKEFRSNDQARDHARRDGERILAEAARHFGLGDGRAEDFKELPRGDLRRVAVAWSLCRRTSLKQTWNADRIGLGTGDNVSAQVRKLSARSKKELPPEIRAWMEFQ